MHGVEVDHSRRVRALTTQVQLHLANDGRRTNSKPYVVLKSTSSQEPQKVPQATTLLRGSDPWRAEGTLRLAEVALSRVREALTLNYECTQIGLLLS